MATMVIIAVGLQILSLTLDCSSESSCLTGGSMRVDRLLVQHLHLLSVFDVI